MKAEEVLYRNSRHRRVRGLQYGFWAAALAFGLGAAVLPGVWPAGNALALAILSLIFVTVAVGMEVYRNLYVTQIRPLAEGLLVETLGFRGRRRRLLPWGALHRAMASERRFHARGAVSSTIMLRRPGRWLPFIIDTTDDAFDLDGLTKLVRRRVRRPD